MERLLLDSGDTVSQIDHCMAVVLAFVFCLLSLNACMTVPAFCMFHRERSTEEERQDTRPTLEESDWGNKIQRGRGVLSSELRHPQGN